MFKVKIEKEVSEQDITDIMVGALEGGSNYWYYIRNKTMNKVLEATEDMKGEPTVDRIMKAVLHHDIEVEVHDIEDPTNLLGSITKENIQRGLDLYAKDYNSNIEPDEMDAGDSDTLFQLIVMGEVVYG